MTKEAKKRIGARLLEVMETSDVQKVLSDINKETKQRVIKALVLLNEDDTSDKTTKDSVSEEIARNMQEIDKLDDKAQKSKGLINEACYLEQEGEIEKFSRLVEASKKK